ncbi:MAG TPA: DedA family protein [Rubrobacteraceae bacterium]|jgi:membrane protein DedA with SNARE-associated domain|nr:DedA family protein [Rubrobacteraceae bacterium]
MFSDVGQWISDAISAFGAFGLAALMLLENLFPPIPSEAVLPLAGFFVGRGELNFFAALVASTAGSLAGALVLYVVGKRGGRPLVLNHGRKLGVSEADLDRAEGWFDKYGNAVVLAARMVPIARSIVSLPAGVVEMPLGRFTLLTTLGSGTWNALLIGAGWLLGANWSRVTDFVGQVSNIVLVILVVAFVGLVVWWRRSKRRKTSG